MATAPTPTTPTAICKRAYNVFAGDITLSQYYFGREFHPVYKDELTPAHRANAAITISRLNQVMAAMREGKVVIEWSPLSPKNIAVSPLNSGWRPLAVNIITPKAAKFSQHVECCAGDLYDPEGELDDWCMSNQAVLERIGLWLEHPSATKGWCHLQIVPPKSGRRVFYP